jgi:hypothetical protein
MHGSSQHFQETIRHSDAIRDETIARWEELKGAAQHLSEPIDWQGRMNRCPVATMATAMVLGYVLGGGLFTRFTGKIIKIGSRLIFMPMMRNKAKSWMYSLVEEEESDQAEGNVTT